MANLKIAPAHTAHLARSSFPMDQGFVYTASTGMILPTYSDLINVGESLYINSSLGVRTQPLVTAAMCDVHINLDWFFVPVSKLYTLFPSLRYLTNDPLSDFYNLDGPSRATDGDLPLYNLDKHMYCDGVPAQSGQSVYGTEEGLSSRFGANSLNVFRLADMLGYHPYSAFIYQENYKVNPNVFPWRALAYQCIYQEHFRNDMYERKNISAYNCDSLYDAAGADVNSAKRQLFYLRFCQRQKDYFNVTRPQPYLSAINLLGDLTPNNPTDTPMYLLANRVNSDLGDNGVAVDKYGVDADVPAGQLGSVDSNSSIFAQFNSSTGADLPATMNLRLSFAQEKLLRIIGMSKKDYDSQILAHFGFKVPHDVKHEITHLFGQHALIHIGEVISTADTFNGESGSALGQVGGKGYGMIQRRKKSFKFTAPVDGILMCVSTIVPDTLYTSTFDKQNAVTSVGDFFTPEYDKLGSQPLFAYETKLLDASVPRHNIRLGWQYRYQQWKMKYNRATLAFYSPNADKNEVNVYSPWVASVRPLGYRVDETDFDRPYFENFLCTPHDIDNIMVVPYNGSYSQEISNYPWLLYQTDPFICCFNADVKKVSTMSPTGEPDLTTF